MKNELLALLTDRPDDIDWTVLDLKHPAVDWVKNYYDTYQELPALKLFIEECIPDGEDTTALAPWNYYVKEAKDLQFVQEASTYLDSFNRSYADDPKKAILSLRDKFQKLSEPSETKEPYNVAKELEARWELFSRKKGKGIKTGIEPFDEVSGGLNPDSDYLILAARLGQGKSFLAHYIALNMAKQGLNVGIYSGEMDEKDVSARIDTWLTHISNWQLTRGRLQSTETLAEQRKAYEELVPGKIEIVTNRYFGHAARPSDIRRFIKERNLTAILIDQLSLMEPDGPRISDPYQAEYMVSTQLKLIQMEQKIPFVAVSQLNRAAEGEDLSSANLSGSDKKGQDASIVLALERSKDSTEVTIKCLKAREFKVPPKGFSFTWDIDTGVLSHIATALDSIKARSNAAKKLDKVQAQQQEVATTSDAVEEEDYG